MRVPTLGDLLVQTRPESRVVSLSPKDRSAAFLAGRDSRHVVYWYDKTSGRLVTSAAYDTVGITGSMSKAIVDRFNRERAGAHLPGRFGLLWKQLEGTRSRPPAAFDLAPYQIRVWVLVSTTGWTSSPAGTSKRSTRAASWTRSSPTSW